jgi:transposase-like protein
VLWRHGLVLNPSEFNGHLEGARWLLGGIEEGNGKRFFVEIVPNRTTASIVEVLRTKIREGTKIRTDGYPSYPRACQILNLEHEVVNHTEGFRSVDGVHTNKIENLWSHLRDSIRCRHGVIREKIFEFLQEFSFLHAFVDRKNHLSVISSYLLLLKELFKTIINN